jgi:hypothetical protein
MTIRASILLLAGSCILVTECQRESAVAGDSFHLTVERVITDKDVIVSILKIHTSHEASISVDGDGSHCMVVLPAPSAGVARDGQVALSASRVARQGDDFAYIQTLIRAGNSTHGFAGGSGDSSGSSGDEARGIFFHLRNRWRLQTGHASRDSPFGWQTSHVGGWQAGQVRLEIG